MSEDVLKFKIKVITEKEYDIVLPKVYLEPENIASWERALWGLGEDPAGEIVDYIGRMAGYGPGVDHDGIGKIHTRSWEKPNREEKPFTVEAYETDEFIEVDILSREDRE